MKRLAVIIAFAGVTACDREAPRPTESVATAASVPTEVLVPAAAQAEAEIETRPVKTTVQPDMLRVPGHIALADNRRWRVGVRTNGLIAEVNVGPGDLVRKEQVLARYHADELRDSRAQYRAAQLELARAESAAVVAGRNSDRAEKLLELKAASQQQVEQAAQDLVTARTTVRTAQNEVDRLKGLLENDLHVQVETKPGDETADQVPILAPASGYVLEKNVTPGKAIHTDDDAFVIGDLSQVWMLASVRQDQLAPLRRGQSVRVDVPGIAGQVFDGTLTDLGQQLDPATRTMQVRIVLNNSRNALRPGMLATAAIPASEPRTTVLVPSDAVQQIDGQDVVFVRTAPDRFAIRPVQTAATVNGETAVVRGLKDGEHVVVHGSFVLKSQLLRAAIEEGD